MFNLEQSIAEWRKQVLAAGIKSPVPLEELESHLRDEMPERVRSGLSEQVAFDMTIRQIGQAEVLQPEFAKVGNTISERVKQLFRALAGIPNYQLATNMNTSSQHLEPGWATYLKSAAYILPALFVWIGSFVLVVPKLKEICSVSGTTFPKPILIALVLADCVRNNSILGTVVILAALILLEWRSRRWPRQRRLVFGITAFSLNFITLAYIAGLLVFAVVVGANLSHHAR